MKHLFILVFGVVTSLTVQADVIVQPLTKGGSDALWISGQIIASDPASLEKYLPLYRNHVFLDSPGGDVQAAMDLGRILRRMGGVALVDYEKICVSACIFVLAGAVDKIISGKIGIHRPYQPIDNIVSPKQQRAVYLQIENQVKKYLSDMNVNPTLYDDMIRISPGKMKILNADELERYGLSGTDPYVEEARTTQEANSLRISKQELLTRKARAQEECAQHLKQSDGQEFATCTLAIRYGISVNEYKRRAEIAEQQCGVSGTVPYARCYDSTIRGF